MESVLADLAHALRERLAIIHDDESRRNADAHMARLQAISEKIEELQAALTQPVDTRLAIISSAAVTTKRWNSWKILSRADRGRAPFSPSSRLLCESGS